MKCICCGNTLKQDTAPTHQEGVVQVTRYFYCVYRACIRYRLLVVPE